MAKRCYYEVLEVERTASDGDLKVAYRKLAMKFHPDRNAGDKDAEPRFKEINEAYEVLSDPNKRAHYDRFGTAGSAGFDGVGGFGSGFGDIFDWRRRCRGGSDRGEHPGTSGCLTFRIADFGGRGIGVSGLRFAVFHPCARKKAQGWGAVL